MTTIASNSLKKVKYFPVDTGISRLSSAHKGKESELFSLLKSFVETNDTAYVQKIFDHITKGTYGTPTPGKADIENHFETLSKDENWADYTNKTDSHGRKYDMSYCEVNGVYNMVVAYHGNVPEEYNRFIPQEALKDKSNKTAFAQQFVFNPKGDYCSVTCMIMYGLAIGIGSATVATLVSKALKKSIAAVATKVVTKIREGKPPNLTEEEQQDALSEAESESDVTMELDTSAFEAALDEGLTCAIIGDFIAAGVVGLITIVIIAIIIWLWHLIDKVFYVNHIAFNMSGISYQFFGPYTDNVAHGPGQLPPMLNPTKVSNCSLPGAFTPPPIPGMEITEVELLNFSSGTSTAVIHYGMFGVLNNHKLMEGVGYLFSMKDSKHSSSEPSISAKYEVHYGTDNEQAIAIGDSRVDTPKDLYDNIGKKQSTVDAGNVGKNNKTVLQGTNDIGHRSDDTFRVITVVYDSNSF